MALADQDQLIIEEIDATIDLLALHSSDPGRYPYLLESRAQNETARFDIEIVT